MNLATIARHFIHTILPVECTACGTALGGDPVPFFCRACWDSIRPLRGPFCPACGRPFSSPHTLRLSPTHVCRACRQRRPAFQHARSLYAYAPPLQDAIRLFKYKKKVALADALGHLLDQGLPVLPPVDVVIPVPLHISRLREREYNQSLQLADRLCRTRGLPLSYDNLVRTRRTLPQTELTRARRMKNLRGAFAVLRAADIAAASVLLIDDVFTTGATVNECARVLRKAGAGPVSVVTLARTL